MKDEIKEINIPENVLVALGDLTNGALNYYKATETIKVKYNTILDYITNLQEENRQTKLLKEQYQLEKEDYKSRNEKAIKCIKDKYYKEEYERKGTFTNKLMNILQEENKTLYKYTPEKGFRLVGDDNER